MAGTVLGVLLVDAGSERKSSVPSMSSKRDLGLLSALRRG
jgi:hypothetical protein